MINPMQATRMASQTTKVIHSRGGVLGSVTINTKAASAVLTLYNNTIASGDIIAVIDCASSSLYLKYNCACPGGLTAVLSGGNADVTIMSEGPGV